MVIDKKEKMRIIVVIIFTILLSKNNLAANNDTISKTGKFFIGMNLKGKYLSDYSFNSKKNVPKEMNIEIVPELGIGISKNIYSSIKLGFGKEKRVYKNQYNYQWTQLIVGVGIGYIHNINRHMSTYSELESMFRYTYYKSLDFNSKLLQYQESPAFIQSVGIGIIYNVTPKMKILPELNLAYFQQPSTSKFRELRYILIAPRLSFRFNI